MEINIAELQMICNRLFQEFKDRDINTVYIDADYYWYIPEKKIYNPYEEPDEFSIGQLTDDWKELRKILVEGRDPQSYDCVWLAAILRAVGENTIF